MGFGGSSGGGGSIAGSSDAAMNNPANDDVLKYDSVTSKWKNAPVAAGLSQVPTVVRHGATASTARPSVVGPVFWFGTVEPDNIVDGDFYWEVENLGGGGGPGFTGAFNGFAATHRAVSLRRLLTSYTGPAIRVRRSSDSTELDIGFTSSGDLDTTGILDFVGSGSGYVSSWYDQSGNGNHFAQTTAAAQPRIVNNGVVDLLNGKPALIFDGTDDFLWSSVVGLYSSGSATVTAVLAGQSGGDSDVVFSESSTTGHFYRMIRNNNSAWSVYAVSAGTTMWNATSANTSTFTGNTQRHFFYADSGSQISTWLNGAVQHDAITATRGSAPSVSATGIGAHVNAGAASSFFAGSVQEIVAWGSLQSASRSSISSAQTTYWGVV